MEKDSLILEGGVENTDFCFTRLFSSGQLDFNYNIPDEKVFGAPAFFHDCDGSIIA